MLDKTFDPQAAESRWYDEWEDSGAFQPKDDPDAKTFCIVIPPPNVTGSLHIGHALNNTLQDSLVRYQRMLGKRVLWQPGTDHAGIATQMVVERQLAAEGNISRRDMGREAFIERVWKWKGQSGGSILRQLRRLGASCDWSRERFTLDEGLSAAVLKVFVELHEQGLIYRDKRLVNWDPHFQTAISDLEVENKEIDGHFWHFAYPLANGSTYEFPIAHDEDGNPTEWETRDYILVATTRPETMLGDTGVAVHPDDERYKDLVGKKVRLPIADVEIPIVTDEHADPEQGAGAVKITPAHDFNDFMVGQRAGLASINLFDPEARFLSEATAEADDKGLARIPEDFRGLDRFEARKKIVARMDELGCLKAVEDKKIMQPFGDRSGVVVEPYLTDQWFVDAETLAKPAIEAVETGKTKFVPKNWEKTYFEWMRNIEPWCISRQLWWGHRIPAWYDEDGNIFVAETEAAAQAQAKEKHGKDVALTQDEDVLDTWFSSALWPFSTLGWPEETDELKAFYPTTVLITAFDIIFFWVARMMMQGIHFMDGEIPFHDVFIHRLVVDANGQKMSKSKGNVTDPLDIVDRYGADALRFALVSGAAQNANIRVSEDRFESARNFTTKLWNAARFGQMNGFAPDPDFDPADAQQAVNRWIIGESIKAGREVARTLENYRFNDAANTAYRFAWNVYCDWFLELAKPILNGEDEAAIAETRAAGAWALDQILRILHPFMPFVTEELWNKTAGEAGRGTLLISADWPDFGDDLIDEAAAADLNWLIDLVTEIRSVRAGLNVPPAATAPLIFVGADQAAQDRAKRLSEPLRRLARVTELEFADAAPEKSVQAVVGGSTFALRLEDLVDLDAERARLAKELEKWDAEITRFEKKLGNEKFVANAPEAVVAGEREKLAEAQAQKDKLEAAQARLDG